MLKFKLLFKISSNIFKSYILNIPLISLYLLLLMNYGFLEFIIIFGGGTLKQSIKIKVPPTLS